MSDWSFDLALDYLCWEPGSVAIQKDVYVSPRTHRLMKCEWLNKANITDEHGSVEEVSACSDTHFVMFTYAAEPSRFYLKVPSASETQEFQYSSLDIPGEKKQCTGI